MTPAGTKGSSDPYLVQHVREALAEDGRIGELEIQVEIEGEALLITGHVATQERKDAVSEVVEEVASDRRIVNDLEVVELADPKPEALG